MKHINNIVDHGVIIYTVLSAIVGPIVVSEKE